VLIGHQVAQAHAAIGELLGDRHDQAEVRLDHPLARDRVAVLPHATGELFLLLRREQLGVGDVVEIPTQIGCLGHHYPPLSSVPHAARKGRAAYTIRRQGRGET